MLNSLKLLSRSINIGFRLILCLLFVNNGSLSAADKIIQIVSENNYPVNYIDQKDGALKGYTADLIRAIMDDTGLQYEIKVKPWARVLSEAINNKNTIIYSVGRTSDREEKLHWIGKLFSVHNKIYGLRNDKAGIDVSLEQLKNSNISVSRDSLNYIYLKENNFMNLISVNSYEQTYELLLRGRTDYFASSVLGAYQFIKKNNLHADAVVPVLNLHSVNPTLYLAANVETDHAILMKIKASYQKLYDNGKYEEIMGPLLDDQNTLRQSTEK